MSSVRTKVQLGLCCVLLAGALGHPGRAAAVEIFGSYGTGAGEFIEPNGIAVDNVNGDLYVLDSNNQRVDKFTKDGRFLFAFGWGVADGKTRALQRCTTHTACHPGMYGPGPGQFGFAEGVAVDNDPSSPSFRDLYAVDISNHRVEKFSRGGRFLEMLGGGVNSSAHARRDASSEDRCPVAPGDSCGTGITGSAPGEFDFGVEGNYIAVGNTGTVYVGDRNRVQEFTPTGNYHAQVMLTPAPRGSGSELGGTIALAVGSGGDMYVVRNGVAGVRKYSPTGALEQVIDARGELSWNEGPTPNLTLDQAGHLILDYHVGERHWLSEYDGRGRELATIDEGQQDALHGMVYDAPAGKLYLINANNNIEPVLAQVRSVSLPQSVDLLLASFALEGPCLVEVCL